MTWRHSSVSRKELDYYWEQIRTLANKIDSGAIRHGTQAERNDAQEIRQLAEARLKRK
ncbi:hypothetical protein CHLORIS_126 [Vibrio phage Chloris]|nr:hypothetical protein CHLORIS_126 [Vibrio phage Chloris]